MVLSFGELLLRICPDADSEWLKDNSLSCYVGGAEANVATALALWEIPSAYFTALPDNMMSHQLLAYLDYRGIDTSRVIFQGNRLGLYFLPKGRDLKNAGVIYDRAHSSFAELRPGTIDWDKVFKDVKWLHFTAISPALNATVATVFEEALKAASERKIFTSVDLNYRARLWQYGKAPVEVMPRLVQYCDLVMGNLWAAEKMLGVPVDAELSEGGTKDAYLAHAEKTSKEIIRMFPKTKIVANTFRFDKDGTGIQYYTTIYTDGRLYDSQEYTAGKIVDKVGSGDCFMAGLIYGQYSGKDFQDTLEFATAAAFRKLFIANDATNERVEEIEKSISTYER